MINFIRKFLSSLTDDEFLYFQKQIWDEDERRREINHQRNPPAELSTSEIQLIINGNGVDALKAYRLRTGCELRDAAKVIDTWRKQNT